MAPITPGTQAQSVSAVTRIMEPHPLSMTARGGKIRQNKALRHDIVFYNFSAKIQKIPLSRKSCVLGSPIIYFSANNINVKTGLQDFAAARKLIPGTAAA